MNEFDSTEAKLLLELQNKFQKAIQAKHNNDIDLSNRLFKEIINIEPRIAEARFELAHNYLETKQLEEAQSHSEEATRILEDGGQWLEDISENSLLAMAYSLQGEIYREQANSDEVVFRNPDEFHRLLALSKSFFVKAAATDPNNEFAQYWGGSEESWHPAMSEIDEDLLNLKIPEEDLLDDNSDEED